MFGGLIRECKLTGQAAMPAVVPRYTLTFESSFNSGARCSDDACAVHALCPLSPSLQEIVGLKEQHKEDMAAAARLHEEAVQVQQQDAKEQLAEQGRAVANAEKAVRNANDASKQASQVPHPGPWWRVGVVHLCKSSCSKYPYP